MKRILLRSCILTAGLLVLPGCLAINAVLGVMGFLGSGPIQLAGTVYSVSEYTYEYAVNDKTPDEVIEDKLSWLMTPDETPELAGYAKAFRKSATAMADTSPETVVADASPNTWKSLTLAAPKRESTPVVTAALRPVPETKTAAQSRRIRQRPEIIASETVIPGPVPAAENTPQRPAVVHTYVERETDPLLARLNKLEQGFRQAEAIAANQHESGVRLSVDPDATPVGSQGINGSWSIRHRVMEHAPATPIDS